MNESRAILEERAISCGARQALNAAILVHLTTKTLRSSAALIAILALVVIKVVGALERFEKKIYN